MPHNAEPCSHVKEFGIPPKEGGASQETEAGWGHMKSGLERGQPGSGETSWERPSWERLCGSGS